MAIDRQRAALNEQTSRRRSVVLRRFQWVEELNPACPLTLTLSPVGERERGRTPLAQGVSSPLRKRERIKVRGTFGLNLWMSSTENIEEPDRLISS